MNLEILKKKWERYCDEFENSEYMDIEKHVNMASTVGLLIQEIERLQDELKHSVKVRYAGKLHQRETDLLSQSEPKSEVRKENN